MTRQTHAERADTFKNSRTRHGTQSGWSKHIKLGERPCDACYRAKSAYDRERRDIPENKIRDRAYARAQGRATTRLRGMFPDEYRALYEEERATIFADLGLTDT